MERLKIEPVPFLTRVQDAHPQDFWTNLCLANDLLDRKKFADAIRFFQAAIALRPDAVIARHNLAVAFAKTGQHAEAIEQCRHALEVDPDSYLTSQNLALQLFAVNRPAEAIEPLRAFLKHDPKNIGFIALLGVALDAAGDTQNACQQFREANRLSPRNPGILYSLRFELLKVRQDGEAAELWKQSIDLEPDNHDRWNGYAEFCLLCGNDAEYRRACDEMLRRFGSSTDPHVCERVARAVLLLPPTMEQLKLSHGMIDRAVQSERAKPTIYLSYYKVSLALADLCAGKFATAIEDLHGKPMTVLGPAPGLILSMAEFHLGQVDQARRDLAKAIASFDWNNRSDLQDFCIYQILRNQAEQLIGSAAYSSR